MNKKESKKVQSAMKTIARKENISVDEVRQEISLAINEGLHNNDPFVRALWERIPCKGETPEPEELVTWLAEQVKEKLKNNS